MTGELSVATAHALNKLHLTDWSNGISKTPSSRWNHFKHDVCYQSTVSKALSTHRMLDQHACGDSETALHGGTFWPHTRALCLTGRHTIAVCLTLRQNAQHSMWVGEELANVEQDSANSEMLNVKWQSVMWEINTCALSNHHADSYEQSPHSGCRNTPDQGQSSSLGCMCLHCTGMYCKLFHTSFAFHFGAGVVKWAGTLLTSYFQLLVSPGGL